MKAVALLLVAGSVVIPMLYFSGVKSIGGGRTDDSRSAVRTSKSSRDVDLRGRKTDRAFSSRLGVLAEDWTPEQFEKFKRARARFSPDYWSDERLAIYISDSDPQMDLDDPKVRDRLFAKEAREREKSKYLLPKEKALAHARKGNDPLAYIFAAYASGTDPRGGKLDESILEEARNRFKDNPDLIYASLLANKSFLTNLEDIQLLRKLDPQGGIADLMEASYWLNQGAKDRAWELLTAAGDKERIDYGIKVRNEELKYRVESGENIRAALLSGSRVSDASDEIVFSYLDSRVSYAASDQYIKNSESDWDHLAAYSAYISYWRESGGSIASQIWGLDRQIEMAKILNSGGKWDLYSKEPYDAAMRQLNLDFTAAKQSAKDLESFISTANERTLQQFVALRAEVGEIEAMKQLTASK